MTLYYYPPSVIPQPKKISEWSLVHSFLSEMGKRAQSPLPPVANGKHLPFPEKQLVSLLLAQLEWRPHRFSCCKKGKEAHPAIGRLKCACVGTNPESVGTTLVFFRTFHTCDLWINKSVKNANSCNSDLIDLSSHLWHRPRFVIQDCQTVAQLQVGWCSKHWRHHLSGPSYSPAHSGQ